MRGVKAVKSDRNANIKHPKINKTSP